MFIQWANWVDTCRESSRSRKRGSVRSCFATAGSPASRNAAYCPSLQILTVATMIYCRYWINLWFSFHTLPIVRFSSKSKHVEETERRFLRGNALLRNFKTFLIILWSRIDHCDRLYTPEIWDKTSDTDTRASFQCKKTPTSTPAAKTNVSLPPNAPNSGCPTSGPWLCFLILFFFCFLDFCCVSYCTSFAFEKKWFTSTLTGADSGIAIGFSNIAFMKSSKSTLSTVSWAAAVSSKTLSISAALRLWNGNGSCRGMAYDWRREEVIDRSLASYVYVEARLWCFPPYERKFSQADLVVTKLIHHFLVCSKKSMKHDSLLHAIYAVEEDGLSTDQVAST